MIERNGVRHGGALARCAAFLGALLAGVSCGPNTRLARYERALDTDSKIKFDFHRIADDPSGIGLRFPGLVLGFEKAKPKVIQTDREQEDGCYTRVDLSKARGAKPELVRDKLESTLTGKCIFLSHLIEYRYSPTLAAVDHHFHYNLYAALRSGAESSSRAAAGGSQTREQDQEPALSPEQVEHNLESAYGQSWTALDGVGATLESTIGKAAAGTAQPTHIVLYTLGWYSGQTEALRNVNSLHLALKRAYAAAYPKEEFRPYPVVVTWPSHWRVGERLGLSYRNKAQDADELGAVAMNVLINQQLLPFAAKNGMRTIAIGHSFGARAISRGLFSGDMLVGGSAKEKWDLFLGLQGAFSMNRFVDWRDADEGSPYLFYRERVRNIVLTWSSEDEANPIAFWSRHAGGKKGHKYASLYEQEVGRTGRPVFRLRAVAREQTGTLALAPDSALIDYLDASSFIRYGNYGKGGGAHNDVYTEDVGKLLANAVHTCAPTAAQHAPSEVREPPRPEPTPLPPSNAAPVPVAASNR
jgi:hypothetical protein